MCICVNSALYTFATFLHNILYKNLPNPRSFIKKFSFDLFQSLSDLRIDLSAMLVSLDVVSLFTSIPLDFALDGMKRRWNFIRDKTSIPLESFIVILEFVLSFTYFSFNNNIYQQTYDTPMRSLLSHSLLLRVEVVMQDLEESCLNKLKFTFSFYYRYVDDILLAVCKKEVDFLVDIFNSYHLRLKFTVELEKDRSINFLDTTISTIVNNSLKLNWYHKSIFSERYLNFSRITHSGKRLKFYMELLTEPFYYPILTFIKII